MGRIILFLLLLPSVTALVHTEYYYGIPVKFYKEGMDVKYCFSMMDKVDPMYYEGLKGIRLFSMKRTDYSYWGFYHYSRVMDIRIPCEDAIFSNILVHELAHHDNWINKIPPNHGVEFANAMKKINASR